jgi:hypothetical protein
MVSYKLGYIFFKSLGETLDLKFSYDFQDNIKFKREVPLINEGKWHEWLGLQWQDIINSNAVLEARITTEHPEVLDGENENLTFRCRILWVSLMLTGPFYLDNAYFLTGSEINSELEIRQFFKFDRWFHPGDDFVREITDAGVKKWKNIFQQVDKIYEQKEDFLRLKRGLHCFLKGCSESQVNFRLPYFVRSLEALIMPDIGKTTKQFTKRVVRWWKDKNEDKYFSEDTTKVLKDIYDIRCNFEHMHDLEKQLEEKQLLRSYQCEEIVRKAYQAILLSDSELEKFTSDTSIRKYWNE